MNSRELSMAAMFLDMASEVFSSNGMSLEFPDAWTQQECDEFLLSVRTWNGNPNGYVTGGREIIDWLAMSFLAHKLRAAAEVAEKQELLGCNFLLSVQSWLI